MSGMQISAGVLLAGLFGMASANAAVSEHLNLEKANGCLAGSGAALCDSLPGREQHSGVGSESLNSYQKNRILPREGSDLSPSGAVAARANLVSSLGAALQGKKIELADVNRAALVQPRRAAPGSGTLSEGGSAEVPLPASIWLFGSALVGFVTWSRRRAR